MPLWVKIGCGVAIAAGTYVGGWQIINTMGNRLTEIEAPQGFAAESSGASVILAFSYFGYPLSTTHVVSGAVVGSGIGKRPASVQWGTAGQMAGAWLLTIPGAAIIAAAAFEGADLFGKGNAGPVIVGLIAAGLAAVLYVVTQRTPVRANDLDRSHADARSLADGRSGGRMIPASSLIDFDALWKIVVAGFAGGAGVVVASGSSCSGARITRRHARVTSSSRGTSVLLAALGGVLCAAALIVGFIALTEQVAIDNPRAPPRAN